MPVTSQTVFLPCRNVKLPDVGAEWNAWIEAIANEIHAGRYSVLKSPKGARFITNAGQLIFMQDRPWISVSDGESDTPILEGEHDAQT